MFFGHGIKKDPFSQVCLKNISFGPSRRPSGAGLLRYRESFLNIGLIIFQNALSAP